jgi:hypothetical protein
MRASMSVMAGLRHRARVARGRRPALTRAWAHRTIRSTARAPQGYVHARIAASALAAGTSHAREAEVVVVRGALPRARMYLGLAISARHARAMCIRLRVCALSTHAWRSLRVWVGRSVERRRIVRSDLCRRRACYATCRFERPVALQVELGAVGAGLRPADTDSPVVCELICSPCCSQHDQIWPHRPARAGRGVKAGWSSALRAPTTSARGLMRHRHLRSVRWCQFTARTECATRRMVPLARRQGT